MRGAKQKEMFEISDLRRSLGLSVCFPPRGGGTLIYSYIRRLGLFFWFKILNFNIFGVFIKLNIFGDMKILWILFRKIGLYLEVISMHLRVFSESQGTEWRIFFWLLKVQIFIWGS